MSTVVGTGSLLVVLVVTPFGGSRTESEDPTVSQAMPMVAVPAAARVPTAPEIDRARWSFERGPRSAVIDTGAAQVISALRYAPGPGGPPTRVARYSVAVSLDSRHWKTMVTGRWARDDTVKTASFGLASARFVRLASHGSGPLRLGMRDLELLGVPRASTRASSAATTTPPSSRPGAVGRWSHPIGMPLVPVSAILLPHDKVLTFAGYRDDDYDDDLASGYTQISILDVARRRAGHRQISATHHEMFCTGLSVLPDGRVLITGGSSASNTTIYDPATDEFSVGPQMAIPRGYQSSVTLSDGRVFTIGGSWSGGEGGKDAEVLSRDASQWTALPGAPADAILTDDAAGIFRADNHAWLFATSGAGVFQAGPSDQMNWFSTAGEGATVPAGERGDSPDAMNGNAVMYAPGRILTLGGAENYSESPATRAAYTVDIRGGRTAPVSVARTGDLPQPRTLANSVVLPTGDVVVTGGQDYSLPFSDEGSVLEAAMWSPRTGRFRRLAPEAIPRNYHSWSLLLADGRVLAGGGGLCDDCETNHPDAEVLTPPYLLRPDGTLRPRARVTSRVPEVIRAGGQFVVRSSSAVRSWVLVRTGSATHSVDSDQRRVTLRSKRIGRNAYRLRVPGDRGTAVPGSYLLFGVDRAGTPTRGSWMRVF